ncbi:unnamed protein product, partial [Nesidiocoris tenuis]
DAGKRGSNGLVAVQYAGEGLGSRSRQDGQSVVQVFLECLQSSDLRPPVDVHWNYYGHFSIDPSCISAHSVFVTPIVHAGYATEVGHSTMKGIVYTQHRPPVNTRTAIRTLASSGWSFIWAMSPTLRKTKRTMPSFVLEVLPLVRKPPRLESYDQEEVRILDATTFPMLSRYACVNERRNLTASSIIQNPPLTRAHFYRESEFRKNPCKFRFNTAERNTEKLTCSWTVQGFIVVAACVMTFEARDSAAKVVPTPRTRQLSSYPARNKSARLHQGSMRSAESRRSSSWGDIGQKSFSTRPRSSTSPPEATAVIAQSSLSSAKVRKKISVRKCTVSKYSELSLRSLIFNFRQALSVDNPDYRPGGGYISPPGRSRQSLGGGADTAGIFGGPRGSQASMAMDLHLDCPVTLKIRDRTHRTDSRRLVRQRQVELEELDSHSWSPRYLSREDVDQPRSTPHSRRPSFVKTPSRGASIEEHRPRYFEEIRSRANTGESVKRRRSREMRAKSSTGSRSTSDSYRQRLRRYGPPQKLEKGVRSRIAVERTNSLAAPSLLHRPRACSHWRAIHRHQNAQEDALSNLTSGKELNKYLFTRNQSWKSIFDHVSR